MSNLAPGTYDIAVQSPGFRTLTRRGVSISANTLRREDVTLELGQVNESVTVDAGVVALQTDTADVHAELSSRDVINMPLPKYRNYQTLVNLVPGATPGQYQNSVQAAPARALSTNVNGVNRNNNATRIDGALSVFLWLPHHTAYVPPAETIETVNIVTNNFDAEQGFAGGAAITVITKSGTNNFHGSAWELHDNGATAGEELLQLSCEAEKPEQHFWRHAWEDRSCGTSCSSLPPGKECANARAQATCSRYPRPIRGAAIFPLTTRSSMIRAPAQPQTAPAALRFQGISPSRPAKRDLPQDSGSDPAAKPARGGIELRRKRLAASG